MVGVKQPIPGVVYPPAERLRAYLAAGELPEIGLAEALCRSFATHAARPALHSPEGSITYAELEMCIRDRCGRGLRYDCRGRRFRARGGRGVCRRG